ncbi:hypothetical protein SAMN05443582_103282 [Phyllobacterium sp. OV277]|nr:hypothetical protein SAMN05443582_103282 [Phyllobacterium sp. OV277]
MASQIVYRLLNGQNSLHMAFLLRQRNTRLIALFMPYCQRFAATIYVRLRAVNPIHVISQPISHR